MGDKFTSPREIAQLNIERYSKLLQTSLDEVTRTTVEKLLANEKAKLAMAPDERHFEIRRFRCRALVTEGGGG